MKKGILSFVLCFALFSFSFGSDDFGHFIGASGITRSGNELLIVGDKDQGAYYKYPLGDERGPRIPLELNLLQRIPLPGACLALDLESIEVLADGRVVVLSERISALVSAEGLVAEYAGPFSELAGMGVEGVAVRPIENEGSRVAIVWEGGYPLLDKIHSQISTKVAKAALRPVVLVHDLQKNQNSEKIKFREAQTFELNVPVPPGTEPQAQRFRVPDLVWHKLNQNGKEEWGFIALLNSQNSMDNPQFLYDYLLRFDSKGEPVGDPIDLNKIMPANLHFNWEGLGWFENGKSLILIFDNSAEQAPAAYVVELPEDWK